MVEQNRMIFGFELLSFVSSFVVSYIDGTMLILLTYVVWQSKKTTRTKIKISLLFDSRTNVSWTEETQSKVPNSNKRMKQTEKPKKNRNETLTILNRLY